MTATITTSTDGLGGMWVYAGPVLLGRVFPAAYVGFPDPKPVPGCRWFGRRVHGKARPFLTDDEAYEYVCAGQETS